MNPTRVLRSAIVLKPSTLLHLHQVLAKRKDRRLLSPKRRRQPGPKGPNQELVDAVVELKRPDPNLESRGSGIENKRVTGKTFMRFRCAGKTGKVVGVKDSSIIITGIERTPDNLKSAESA